MPKHEPTRSCAVCLQRSPKRELTRVVRASDGNVEVDPSGKAPGRGAYLCHREECWEKASRKGRLEHALRSPLSEQHRDNLYVYYIERVKPAAMGAVR